MHLLILGGTAEAATLAGAASSQFGDALTLTTSLAGRTAQPRHPAGRLRQGGFGGAEAMSRYLRETPIDLVIDATHPFAARISAQAGIACAAASIPLLTLLRPSWQAEAGDHWIDCADGNAAASCLPQWGRRAFLTIGVQGLAAFGNRPDLWCLVRLLAPPAESLPLGPHQIILGRPPIPLDQELAVLAQHRIDVLVTKAAGGAAAKLVAARILGLPVLMIRRPPAPATPAVTTIPAALDWLAMRLAAGPSRPLLSRE